MNILVKNIKKILKQYSCSFSSLKNTDFLLSKKIANAIYSECSQELLPLAPFAVKKFEDEYAVDLLDYYIEQIVSEALQNIVCIWENKERIENTNPELPIYIDLNNKYDSEKVESFDNEDKQKILDFFRENNYELCYIIENNVKYYFLKDLELNIIEKNYAISVVSKNAFERNLEVLFKSIKKEINDYLTNSESKLIYGVVKCVVDKRFNFFIEKDASFFENYDKALNSYINKTLKKLEECKINSIKNIYTECDADDAWKEMLCKNNLEYYERLVALEIN